MSPASRAVGAILVTRGDAPLTQSVLRAIENQSMAPRSLTIIDVAGRRVTPFPADRVGPNSCASDVRVIWATQSAVRMLKVPPSLPNPGGGSSTMTPLPSQSA